MDIKYFKIENNTIIQTTEDVNPEDWQKEIDWINVQTEDRKDVTNYFQNQKIYATIKDCIEHPETYPFSNTFEDTIVLNLSISNVDNIYSTDYISVILKTGTIITIVPQNTDMFNERNLSAYTDKKYPTLRNFLFYILGIKILAQSNVNMSTARIRLQGIEQLLTNEPEELSSNDLMSCERDINQLSDIIEDQYVGFEILGSIISSSVQHENQQSGKLIKGFEPLDKAVLRLEKKAESLRLQYMLYQQEKSTHKINVLTIIQAIFVPLTFIAGVYGMNFVVMPELNWPFGYLFVWLVFIGMASGLLIYFYRKGWFN